MSTPQALDRQALRSRFLAQRSLLSPVARTRLSLQIIEALLALPVFRDTNHLFIYCNYHSEVETTELIRRCLRAGKTVSVPLTRPDQSRMAAVAITDPDADLAPGYKGIPEPLPALIPSRLLPLETIEIVVVPGAVFDRQGYRLGYGGGYYDRFLSGAAAQARRIGLAFSLQVVERLPVFPHDIPMDIVITEKELLQWPRNAR